MLVLGNNQKRLDRWEYQKKRKSYICHPDVICLKEGKPCSCFSPAAGSLWCALFSFKLGGLIEQKGLTENVRLGQIFVKQSFYRTLKVVHPPLTLLHPHSCSVSPGWHRNIVSLPLDTLHCFCPCRKLISTFQFLLVVASFCLSATKTTDQEHISVWEHYCGQPVDIWLQSVVKSCWRCEQTLTSSVVEYILSQWFNGLGNKFQI